MARVRSTARVEREGGEAEGSETVPISEAMQRSELVTSEGIRTAETEQTSPSPKLPPTRKKEILRKLIPKMIIILPCQVSPATWTSESQLSLRLISPRW
jgi:hypothetical protein